MLRTPLKNSKNVNKPFKSPFESSAQQKDENKTCSRTVQADCKIPDSPLSTRSFEAKRVLVLDNEKKIIKKQKLSMDDEDNDELDASEYSTIKKDKKLKKQRKDDQVITPDVITRSDLLILKKRIFNIRQELDRLKSRERCSKKHDPKDLRTSIDRWRAACQNALEIVCSELRERNGQSSKISEVLKMLGIPESIVHYSEADDAFI